MTNKLRISLIGLIGAVGGFGLQGCFAPQPTPECSVTITAAALALGPYYAKLNKVDGTGTCSELNHMYVGMQRFRTAPSGGAFKLAMKTSPVTDAFLGRAFSIDSDPTNNCVNEADCQGTDDPAASCVVPLEDGGVALFDGTPVVDGSAEPVDGGAPFEVDPANACGVVEEEVARVDPTDPKGAKLVATGDMPQFPNAAGVCTVTNFSGGEQNFQEEVLPLADGSGDFTFPAITYKTEFTEFNVINSARVPGTAFTTNFKYTEGGCTANYKAVGFWPAIDCGEVAPATRPTQTCNAGAPSPCLDDSTPMAHVLVTSGDCDPVADADAGRVFGSGINPDFKPMCDTTLHVCVPTVDVTTLR